MYGGEPSRATDRVSSTSAAIALGQAEVGDVRLAPRVKEDVRGLQVPVQHPRWWAWCTARGGGSHDESRRYRGVAEVGQPLGKAVTLDQRVRQRILALRVGRL